MFNEEGSSCITPLTLHRAPLMQYTNDKLVFKNVIGGGLSPPIRSPDTGDVFWWRKKKALSEGM